MSKVIAENAIKFAQFGRKGKLTLQRAGIRSAVKLSPGQRPLPSHKGSHTSPKAASPLSFLWSLRAVLAGTKQVPSLITSSLHLSNLS